MMVPQHIVGGEGTWEGNTRVCWKEESTNKEVILGQANPSILNPSVMSFSRVQLPSTSTTVVSWCWRAGHQHGNGPAEDMSSPVHGLICFAAASTLPSSMTRPCRRGAGTCNRRHHMRMKAVLPESSLGKEESTIPLQTFLSLVGSLTPRLSFIMAHSSSCVGRRWW